MKNTISVVTIGVASTLLFTSFLTSCSNKSGGQQPAAAESRQSSTMKIEPVDNSPKFPDASLSMESISAKLKGTDSAEVTIHYKVANYELKGQTHDASMKGCANSKDGQHIHFILNNQPYEALYKPENTFMVPVGKPQYLLSFLSRSYHESVKSPNAGFLKYFEITKDGKIKELTGSNQPMIFYSRPKGKYAGADAKMVLLDFYVCNAQLGKNAMVKARINDTTFNISNWQAYFIKNAPLGDLKISLQLTDTSGNPLTGDNTSVSRTVALEK